MLRVNVTINFEKQTDFYLINIIKNAISDFASVGITIDNITIKEQYIINFSVVVDQNFIKISDVRKFFEQHCKVNDFLLDITTFSFKMKLLYSALLLKVKMDVECNAISINDDQDAILQFLHG